MFNPIRGFSRSNLTGLIFQLGCFNHHPRHVWVFWRSFFWVRAYEFVKTVGWKRKKEIPRHPWSLPALFERRNMKEQERNNNRSMQRSTQHSQRQEPMSNKKQVLKVLSWFFIRRRPFYRGCYGGEMNRIVICFSETLFFNGHLHCKEIVKRWSIYSFF